MRNQKIFGLIPAAGHSRRMGQHKLLMPWNAEKVIDVVLRAWTDSKVDQVVVVVREDDLKLIEACNPWPVEVLPLAEETLDMKATVQQGLKFIESNWTPESHDCCLIAPADLPKFSDSVINHVIDSCQGESRVVVPWYGEKQGHPICFPWNATPMIFELGPDEGLNALVTGFDTRRVDLDTHLRPRDIDTPEDYRREQGA